MKYILTLLLLIFTSTSYGADKLATTRGKSTSSRAKLSKEKKNWSELYPRIPYHPDHAEAAIIETNYARKYGSTQHQIDDQYNHKRSQHNQIE